MQFLLSQPPSWFGVLYNRSETFERQKRQSESGLPFFFAGSSRSGNFSYFCTLIETQNNEGMKYLLILLGTISLGLGILGIFLPLLPTTPLLLLASALYLRSSKKLYDRLLDHKYLGSYIRNFQEYKAIPVRAKIISVSLLWGTILYCIFGVIDVLWIQLLLAAIMIGVTVHILSYKTLSREIRKEIEEKERERKKR